MNISPVNPVVHQSIKRYLTKDQFGVEQFYDYDNCFYMIGRSEESPDVLKFGFSCNSYKQIMENGGQDMLNELYKDNLLPPEQFLQGCDITLGIDASGLAKTQKVKKTMTEEESALIRAKNEEIRKERETAADVIATKFACFKRDFMSAPIRQAMNFVIGKGPELKACQIDYRKDEKFWVIGTKTDVSVTFEINLISTEDISLARIFLLELNDSKQNVMNAPTILYHDKTFPENVQRIFPGSMTQRTSNGSISFQVSKSTIEKGMDQPLTTLIGFRQYLSFHLHAIKIQMHSRMRKRVESMELIVKQARRDVQATKIYKEKHGGEQIKEAKEEKKKEEVFKFK